MPRSPLFRSLRRLAREHHAAVHGSQTSRARFLEAGGAAALAAAVTPLLSACGSSAARGRERIAIVGAGIAGLCAALRLHDAAIPATVYESSDRVGGRMHSNWTFWDDAQHTEWCGAMIDTDHRTMRGLAARFRIPLLDTLAAMQPGARDTAYLHGTYYPMPEADRDFAAIYPILERQLAAVGDAVTYRDATPEARRLDAMSMLRWIETYVPGGRTSRLGSLIFEAYRNEYGREPAELSSLNVVEMLGVQRHYRRPGGELNVLGYSDQRYTTSTGNQRLAMAIADALPQGSILLRRRMLAIRRQPGGTYELTFANGGATEKVVADRVVMAIPFIVLRGLDYSGAGFDAAKINAIENLGYGYHTKLHVQFADRPWRARGRFPWPTTGQIWTDLQFQCSVDFSLGQSGEAGLVERFTGAAPGMIDTPPVPYASTADSPVVQREARRFLAMLDEVWPGTSKSWNGKATFGNAQADPNILASYSSWLVGQCTTIAGHEFERQGNCHFAGEHCSVSAQGFMEGGAETGMRAADDILADYRIARLRT
ncbi:MAG TPA: NAD(P)/FAD-dependent oxidoreductase [Verrucomicrobiae bacterium]|nr:NAD(P)/FAD-dependent oxidoreductase [Verrucomicrobiae bacterium]